jgi:hypothetical protein
VERKRKAGDIGMSGIVQRGDLDSMTGALMHSGEAADGFHGATAGCANGGDDVKESHGGRQQSAWRISLDGLYPSQSAGKTFGRIVT